MIKFKILILLSALCTFSKSIAGEPYNTMDEYSKGLKLMGKKDYEQAIVQFKEVINNSPDFLRAYKNCVKAYGAKDNLDGALQFFNQRIEHDPENGCFFYGLGCVYEQKKEYREALNCYRKALMRIPHLQQTYDGFVDISLKMNKENDQSLKEAEIFLKQLIDKDTSNACPYQGLGYLYSVQYQWDDALKLLNKAIQKKPDFWQAYHDKATVYWHTSQYRKALDMLNVEFELAEKSNDIEVMSKANGNKGNVFTYLDDYQNALSCYEKDLFMAEEIGDQTGIRKTTGNIGIVYWKMGIYDKALDHYCRALEMYRADKDRRGEGLIIQNLGNLYSDLGDYEKALLYDENALLIHQETGNKKSVGITLGNIGVDQFSVGNYEKSIEYHEKALEIHRSLENKRSEGICLENLGIAYLKQNNCEKAKDCLDEAFSIDHRIGNKENEGNVLIQLGNLYSILNGYAKSEDCYKKALAIGQDYSIPKVVWKTYEGLGSLYETRGKFTESLSFYQSAIDEIEKVRSDIPTETYKMGFFEDKIEVYLKTICLLSKLHQQNPDENYVRESFRIVEMAKARTLIEGLSMGQPLYSMMNISPELKQSLLINKKSTEKKHTELSSELAEQDSIQNKALILTLKSDIEQLQREEDQLLKELKEKYPAYYQLTSHETIGSREVMQKILGDNQILIEYMIGPEESYIWILTRQTIHFDMININRQQLQDRLASVSPLFRKTTDSTIVSMNHRWANIQPDLSYELYQQLLEKPAGEFLKKNMELIIIPDDMLLYFPFEILATDIRDATIRYLVEDHPVSYSYSASLLNPELHKQPSPVKDLLAFGNPEFQGEQSRGILEWIHSITSFKSILRGNRLESLPFAENEVKSIARLFQSSDVYVGQAATEACFKKKAQDYRFIHLATHHLMCDKQPMYSKIVLSQTTNPMEDGYLQTYEIYNLDLNADLVVLSGCNTGLGHLTRGEGLIGMSRAFLHAGVPSVIVSLWPVEDKSTSLFMIHFYQYLKTGMNKNQALQKAKIDLIHSGDIKSDPFYWGSFVLMGDWKNSN